ncbi:MAG: hypothetical protein V3U17_07085 [Thermoplasmata archaeon]
MRTSAEEGRYRSTQGKEVIAVFGIAILAAVALAARVAAYWVALF